jgi:hypothetical protein
MPLGSPTPCTPTTDARHQESISAAASELLYLQVYLIHHSAKHLL